MSMSRVNIKTWKEEWEVNMLILQNKLIKKPLEDLSSIQVNNFIISLNSSLRKMDLSQKYQNLSRKLFNSKIRIWDKSLYSFASRTKEIILIDLMTEITHALNMNLSRNNLNYKTWYANSLRSQIKKLHFAFLWKLSSMEKTWIMFFLWFKRSENGL